MTFLKRGTCPLAVVVDVTDQINDVGGICGQERLHQGTGVFLFPGPEPER